MVMRHRHHRVELATPGAHEDGVRRERALRIQPERPRIGDGRRNVIDLFAAKQAALARMRVEPRHRDARCRQAKALQGGVRDAQVSSTASRVTRSMASRSEQWMVTSTVRSSSLASIMRTGTPPASACSISVPGVRRAGGVQRFPCEWEPSPGPPLTRLNSADSRIDAGRRRCTSGRGDLPSGRSSKPVGSQWAPTPADSAAAPARPLRSAPPLARHGCTTPAPGASRRRRQRRRHPGRLALPETRNDFRADAADIALGDQQGAVPITRGSAGR